MSGINLKKNILLSGSFRLILMIVAFLTSWLSTRYLGVELKGKYSYFTTISGFIWLVFDLGLYRSFPYLVRKYPNKINNLFFWVIIQFISETLLFSIIGLVFMNTLSHLMDFNFNPLYLFIFVGLITLSQYGVQLQALYLGMNKIIHYSMAQFLGALLTLIMVFIGYFVFKSSDKLAYILIAVLASSIFSIGYYTIYTKWGKFWQNVDFKFIFSAYKYGFRVFLSSLFIVLLIRFDIILIKKYLDFSEVGIYSVAAHIIDLLQMASNIVGGLLLVKLTDTEDEIQKWNIMRKMMLAFFILIGIANVGFVLIGKFLLGTLFGIQFVPVYYAYLWLIPASFSLSFGSLFNNYLNSKGFPIISIILPAIALGINITLNLILIPIMGIAGAAIATSIAYTLWFISIIIYEQRCTNNRMIVHLIPQKEDWIEAKYYARNVILQVSNWIRHKR